MEQESLKELITSIVAILATIMTGGGATYYYGKKKNKCACGNNEEGCTCDNGKVKLCSHPLFAKAELNKNVILSYFTLENKGKEVVFKEILVNHMDIYQKHLKLLCESLDLNRIKDSNELYSKSVELVGNILTDLRTFYLKDNKFTSEEIKVLSIVMSKYNQWNYDREREIINRIQEVCGSAFYPDLYSKAVTVFDTFLFAMNDTVADANKTLNSINGDLKGLKFKGVQI